MGGVRLISSARMMLAKIGPGTNRNARRPASGSSSTFVPVMSEGIRSGVNWIRLKPTSRIRAIELTISVLARPGHADQQHVPAGEDRRQDQLDHLALADDDLVELGDHHVARVAELVEKLRDPVAGRGHAFRRPVCRSSESQGKGRYPTCDRTRDACRGARRSVAHETTIILR